MDQDAVDQLRRRKQELVRELEDVQAALLAAKQATGGETPSTPPPFEHASLYDAILRSATDYAIIAADLEGRIVEWNVGARDVLGWPQEEIVGQDIRLIFTPEDRKAGVPEREMEIALSTGNAMDLRWHLRRDGSRFWADGRMMPLKDRNGVDCGYVKILRDETGRKQSDRLASTHSNVLRLITDQIDTGILQIDPSATIVFVNPAAERLLGWPPAELRGRSIQSTLQHHADGELLSDENLLVSVLTTREPLRDQATVFYRQDGSALHVHCSCSPLIVDGALVGAVIAFNDGSKRRKADELMRAELRRHEALSETQRAVERLWGEQDATFRTIVEGALRVLPQATGAILEMVDGDDSVYRAVIDPRLGEPGERVPLAGSLAGAAIATGEPLVSDDTLTDPRLNRARSLRHGVRSMMVVPIPRDGLFVGVLKVVAGTPQAFRPRDLLMAQILVGYIATSFARTAEADARRQLQLSEERLQLALEASETIGIWDWDVESDRCYGDPRFARLFGIEPAAAAAGLPIDRYAAHVDAEDIVWVKLAARKAMTEGGDFAMELRVVGADGTARWLVARGRSFNGPDGQPRRFPGAVVDITERKRAEALLREAEINARLAVEAAGLGLWRFEPGADRMDLDDRSQSIFGFEATPLPALDKVLGAIHPRSRAPLRSAVQEAMRTGTWGIEPNEFEIVNPRDASPRWIEINAQAFFTNGVCSRIIGTVRDISERKRLEAALREDELRFKADLEHQVAARTDELSRTNARLMEEMAERQRAEEALRQSQKMEAVGQLTGGIAHDFNNLLTGITGSLDLMRKRIGQGRTGELDRYMNAAATSANRAAALTHRLLAFARRQPLDSKPVDVNALVSSMEDLLHRTLGETIEITLRPTPDLWLTFCDPYQLENALLNLVINARDAMPDGGILSIGTANRTVNEADRRLADDRRPGDYVALTVADTGIGIAPDVMARVFEPFFTTKPIGQGTGLGLSMIYGFARQSDGHVTIRSEVGVGTEFTLFLPRSEAHTGAAPEIDRPLGSTMADGETVLVVEDDAVVRNLVVDVLAELGYGTLQAADGMAGLAILQGRGRIDLLVTDVGLPGLNGRQLAEMGRATRPRLRVLFITGYAENATFGNGKPDRSMQMITKPFTIEALAGKIREMVTDPTA